MANRRQLIKALATSPLLAMLPGLSLAENKIPKILKPIPKSGEQISAIGMGSYQTFNVSNNSTELASLINVLSTFFKSGGQLIDSSPMYRNSEATLGKLLSQLTFEPDLFAASKVWTYGKQAGLDAIKVTEKRMQVENMDLMQVHNLRDWEIQLANLNELKNAKQLRYTGITTSSIGQYDDFENVMRKKELDFVQLNYNIKVRNAEKRLLPLAQDKGIAVIVNMPYEKGRLFKRVKDKPLPEWASEFDCKSWGQFFLKFIISHPAVTCAIPATSKVHHMSDNMLAMRGALPDSKMRKKMAEYFSTL
jgi:diketogulonate reductase-like aldo/keto reductase